VKRALLALCLLACTRKPDGAPPPAASPAAPVAAPVAASATRDTSSGAAPNATLGDGDWTFTAPHQPRLVVPKTQRYEPPPAAERTPLVIVLHGLGASGKLAFDLLDLAGFGAEAHALVVAPDGTFDGKKRRFWNADPACCNFEHQPLDDFARLAALIDGLRRSERVDPRRIGLIGLSNGGFMAHQLACRFGDRVAAIVSIGGAGPSDHPTCTLEAPLAVLEIHGDADDIVRYRGGSVFDDASVPPHRSAQQTLLDWGERLRCQGKPSVGAPLDLSPTLPGAETEVETYRECALGSATLWSVHGGHHILSTRPVVAAAFRFLAQHAR
jgi:polyhydroxybutyrate depolymerase